MLLIKITIILDRIESQSLSLCSVLKVSLGKKLYDEYGVPLSELSIILPFV